MPLIVLEGPDGGGKTGLAQECAKYLRAQGFEDTRIVAFGPPPFDPDLPEDRATQAYLNYATVLGSFDPHSQGLILDRYHWGSAVWGPIFRPDHAVDDGFGDITRIQMGIIDSLVRQMGGVTALVENDPETLVKRVLERGDDMAPKDPAELLEFTKRVMELYYGLLGDIHMPSSLMSSIRLDTPSDTVDAAVALVGVTLSRTANVS